MLPLYMTSNNLVLKILCLELQLAVKLYLCNSFEFKEPLLMIVCLPKPLISDSSQIPNSSSLYLLMYVFGTQNNNNIFNVYHYALESTVTICYIILLSYI